MTKVLVIAEHDEAELAPATRKTVGAARQLMADGVDIAVLAGDGARVAAAAAAVRGVGRVLLLERTQNSPCLAAVWAPQIAELAGSYTHVLGPATTFGKDLLPRVAALRRSSLLSDIIAIESPSRFQRPIYAGNAIATIETTGSDATLFATIRTTAFEDPGKQAAAGVEPMAVDVELPGHTRFVERRGDHQTGPDLQSAATVVAGGRGIGGPDGVGLIAELADALGAALGASRAAVDSGWLSNDLQVGQTGKIVAPRLYIGVGISGAIQHLTGIKDAGTIVAVNSDPEAPLCAIADIVLVEDLFTAIPAMIEQVKARRGS